MVTENSYFEQRVNTIVESDTQDHTHPTWWGRVRAFALRSVALGLITLSSDTNDVTIGIHGFHEWHSTTGIMWRVKYETEFTHLRFENEGNN